MIDYVARTISAISLIASLVTIYWTIGKDRWIKSNFKIRLVNVNYFMPVDGKGVLNNFSKSTLNLEIINTGHRKLYSKDHVILKIKNNKKNKRTVSFFNFDHRFSTITLKEFNNGIEPGGMVSVILMLGSEAFIKKEVEDLGIEDNYGRIHWCGAKNINNAVEKSNTKEDA